MTLLTSLLKSLTAICILNFGRSCATFLRAGLALTRWLSWVCLVLEDEGILYLPLKRYLLKNPIDPRRRHLPKDCVHQYQFCREAPPLAGHCGSLPYLASWPDAPREADRVLHATGLHRTGQNKANDKEWILVKPDEIDRSHNQRGIARRQSNPKPLVDLT